MSETLHIDLPDAKSDKKARACERCGVQHRQVKWKFSKRKFLCEKCTLHPDYRQITRTTAMNKFGLTFDELHTAFKDGELVMCTMPNPHGRDKPPMRLYMISQVERLARRIGSIGRGSIAAPDAPHQSPKQPPTPPMPVLSGRGRQQSRNEQQPSPQSSEPRRSRSVSSASSSGFIPKRPVLGKIK